MPRLGHETRPFGISSSQNESDIPLSCSTVKSAYTAASPRNNGTPPSSPSSSFLHFDCDRPSSVVEDFLHLFFSPLDEVRSLLALEGDAPQPIASSSPPVAPVASKWCDDETARDVLRDIVRVAFHEALSPATIKLATSCESKPSEWENSTHPKQDPAARCGASASTSSPPLALRTSHSARSMWTESHELLLGTIRQCSQRLIVYFRSLMTLESSSVRSLSSPITLPQRMFMMFLNHILLHETSRTHFCWSPKDASQEAESDDSLDTTEWTVVQLEAYLSQYLADLRSELAATLSRLLNGPSAGCESNAECLCNARMERVLIAEDRYPHQHPLDDDVGDGVRVDRLNNNFKNHHFAETRLYSRRRWLTILEIPVMDLLLRRGLISILHKQQQSQQQVQLQQLLKEASDDVWKQLPFLLR